MVEDVALTEAELPRYLLTNGTDPERLPFIELEATTQSLLRYWLGRYGAVWQVALGLTVVAVLGIWALSSYQSLVDNAAPLQPPPPNDDDYDVAP